MPGYTHYPSYSVLYQVIPGFPGYGCQVITGYTMSYRVIDMLCPTGLWAPGYNLTGF